MDIFLEKHKEAILGVVEGFDRIIFKGYLTSMFPDGAFGRYLSRRGILLKEAGKFFERETEAIIRHAKTSAEQAGRPYASLESAPTHASGQSKEAKARAIAERDGIPEGLVGIFSVLDAEVGHGANSRLINALANAPLQGEATEILDRLCRSQSKAGQHVAAFNPVTPENCALFEALLSGEFALNGLRNRDLQGKIYASRPTDEQEATRRTHRVSRLIAKLRGHGLIAKVTNSLLYRITKYGASCM